MRDKLNVIPVPRVTTARAKPLTLLSARQDTTAPLLPSPRLYVPMVPSPMKTCLAWPTQISVCHALRVLIAVWVRWWGRVTVDTSVRAAVLILIRLVCGMPWTHPWSSPHVRTTSPVITRLVTAQAVELESSAYTVST